MSTFTHPNLRGVLTTDHSASSYGIPVLVIAGNAYGATDYLPSTNPETSPDDLITQTFGPAPRTEKLAAMHVLSVVGNERPEIVEAFLSPFYAAGEMDFDREVS